MDMDRRLIIDGNAVYEIDEKCMLKKGMEEVERRKHSDQNSEIQNADKMKRTE